MSLYAWFLLFSVVSLTRACIPYAQQAVSRDKVLSSLRSRAVAPSSTPIKTAIRNVRVFQYDDFTEPRTVIFDERDRITWDQKDIRRVIDGQGQFLLPGLIDAHVHVMSDEALINITSYGITTIFNMLCTDFEVCDALRNQPGLASYYTGGVSAVGAGSRHAKFGNLPKSHLVYPDTNTTDMVDWAFKNGSDWFKMTLEPKGPSQEQQNNMVKVTHDHFDGFTVSHASSIYAYEQAARSRTEIIQHIPDDGLLSPSFIAQIKANGQAVTPTMTIFKYGYTYPMIGAIAGYNNSTTNRTWDHVQENVRRLHRAGVPLLSGTDAVGPVMPGVSVPYGLTLHSELEHLVEIGLTPAEALRAATSEPARWHRLCDRGRVAVGQRADLVLLNSNPLLNISNTRDISKVWSNGIEVEFISKAFA